MDFAQHVHTFSRRDAENDIYMCPYKHMFRLHPQHICRRSYHSHQGTTAKLFWNAFRHFSVLCFILSVRISVSSFQLCTTISSFKYYAFYLFYIFSHSLLSVPPFSPFFSLWSTYQLEKSNNFRHDYFPLICIRDSLSVNGFLIDVFTTDCTQENKLNSTEVFSAWMAFLKRA